MRQQNIPYENIQRIGAQSEANYFQSGELVLGCLVEQMADVGLNLDQECNVLDFGCGCGRVSIPFLNRFSKPRLFACDVDASNVAFLPSDYYNLVPLVNLARPPLPFQSSFFDVAFAVSVWTHLNEELQFSWLAEMRRVLKPNGYGFLTIASYATMGKHRQRNLGYTKTISDDDLKKQGFIFLAQKQREDRNWPGTEDYGLTLHAPEYINDEWRKYFEFVHVVPGGIAGGQDIVVVRKSADS